MDIITNKKIKQINASLSDITQQINSGTLGGASLKNIYDASKYGVTGDGTTDDQPALQKLVNDLYTAGGGVIYLPTGTYMLDNAVYWKPEVSLIGAGIGRTILKPRRDVSVRPLSGDSNGKQHSAIGMDFNSTLYTNKTPFTNCHFKDFEIDGNGITNMTTYQVGVKGFYMQFMRNCSFKNIYIHDTVATGLGTDFMDRTVIDGVIVSNCGRGYGTMSGTMSGGAGIGIGTGGLQSENFIITNCIVDTAGQFGIFIENQNLFNATLAPYNGQGAIISNCIVKNGRYNGIGVRGGNEITISNCQSFGNALSGILINSVNTEDLVVSNNIIYSNQEGILIDLQDKYGKAFTITGNNIKENNAEGVYLRSGVMSNLVLDNNVILNNSANKVNKSGVRIDTSITSGSISNNTSKDTRTTKKQYDGLLLNSNATLTNVKMLFNDFTSNLNTEYELLGSQVSSSEISLSELQVLSNSALSPVHVTSITLSQSTATLQKGANIITLTPTIAPANASNQSVAWSSSNNAVAIVDKTGKVTGVSAGTATITATTMDGNYTATCAITCTNAILITDNFNRVDSITAIGSANTGQTWTSAYGLGGISYNQGCNINTSQTYSDNIVNAGTSDVTIQADFVFGGIFAGIVFRYQDSSNYYSARICDNPKGFGLYKYTGGSGSTLGTYAMSPIKGAQYSIKVVAQGSNLTVYLDGVQIITATNTFNSTVTNHGFKIGSATTIDNFRLEGI